MNCCEEALMDYTGIYEVNLVNEELADFYESNGEVLCRQMIENQYLTLRAAGSDEVVDYYRKKGGVLHKVAFPSFKSDFCGTIKPRNPEQYCAMDLLKSDVPIKLLTGKFGSGKTILIINWALEAIQKNQFEKIVFIRNNVQVKDTDPLGALPNGIFDKTLPYVMPFADHCGGVEGLKMLIDSGKLEVIPLGFLRGRSIRNSILYSMESENLTKQHIQLIMGRVDDGTQLVMDGDFKQKDRTIFERSRGLETMVERLVGNEYFGYVNLKKSERSKVAQLADLLDD